MAHASASGLAGGARDPGGGGLFCVAAGVCVPVLAYLVLLREQSPAVPIFLVVLAVVALVYGWRFGLHPSLRADAHGRGREQPRSTDPVRLVGDHRARPRRRTGWWSGPKQDRPRRGASRSPAGPTRRGRRTRADRIVDELCELQDQYDPPLEDEETGIRIRRARWHEHGLLTRLERSASKAALGHVFPARTLPVPDGRGPPTVAAAAP